MGVPCLTGNNHHYFQGTELEKYLVINQETDIDLIKEKILKAVKHREEIIRLYKIFSNDNLEWSRNCVRRFLEIEDD